MKKLSPREAVKVIVKVHVHVRLKGKDDWIDAYVSDAFMMRDDKIIEWHTFVDNREALVWVGLTEA